MLQFAVIITTLMTIITIIVVINHYSNVLYSCCLLLFLFHSYPKILNNTLLSSPPLPPPILLLPLLLFLLPNIITPVLELAVQEQNNLIKTWINTLFAKKINTEHVKMSKFMQEGTYANRHRLCKMLKPTVYLLTVTRAINSIAPPVLSVTYGAMSGSTPAEMKMEVE